MPGLYGAVARGGEKSPSLVLRGMENLLSHQSWYGQATWNEGALGLGALSTHPHFSSRANLADNSQAVLLIEGNALTLDKKSLGDAHCAQKLLAAYGESGRDFVHRLGGQFQLALFDRRDGTLQLINDRNGFAHLFWYLDEEVFLFGPELKTFLAWNRFDRNLNEASFASLLARETPLGTETLFSRVQMLEPASRLTFGPDGVEVERYWRPEPRPEENRTVDDWVEEADTLFQKSFSKRMPDNWQGRVILPLSGGLDSRLLLWQARSQGDRLDLFTHGQDDCTDARLAKEAAAVVDLQHRHHLVHMDPEWAGLNGRRAVWLNDGQLNLRNATLVGISEELEPGPVPFLNGIIGAHMSLGVGGFVRPAEMVSLQDEADLRQRVLTYLGVEPGAVYLPEMMEPARAEKFRGLACEQAWRSFDPYRHIELFGDQKMLHTNYSLGRRMQGTVDVHRFFFHDVLPFVDDELHDLWLRIPLKLRLNNELYKELFRRRMEPLARVPWSHTGLDLFATEAENEASLDRRMKKLIRMTRIRKYSLGLINPRNRDAYTHREVWLRKPGAFRSLMTETLQDVSSGGCQWFDQGLIDSMFRRFDNGRDYLFRPLMQVATVVLWHKLFLGQQHPGFDLQPGDENSGRRSQAGLS